MPRPLQRYELSRTFLNNGDYELVDPLGRGSYGEVYLANDHRHRRVVAVKCIRVCQEGDLGREKVAREVVLHAKASAAPSGVLPLFACAEDERFVYLVLAMCPGRDLYAAIVERSPFMDNSRLTKRIMAQILGTVDWLHVHGIFHRDLKPENIMCTPTGEDILITDFGLATDENSSTQFRCGTSGYMSPENCRTRPSPPEGYDCARNDIWSIGILMVNITCGRHPWHLASSEDVNFALYEKNSDLIARILPITSTFHEVLKLSLAYDPPVGRRSPSIPAIVDALKVVDTFLLSEAETMLSQYSCIRITGREMWKRHRAVRGKRVVSLLSRKVEKKHVQKYYDSSRAVMQKNTFVPWPLSRIGPVIAAREASDVPMLDRRGATHDATSPITPEAWSIQLPAEVQSKSGQDATLLGPVDPKRPSSRRR